MGQTHPLSMGICQAGPHNWLFFSLFQLFQVKKLCSRNTQQLPCCLNRNRRFVLLGRFVCLVFSPNSCRFGEMLFNLQIHVKITFWRAVIYLDA